MTETSEGAPVGEADVTHLLDVLGAPAHVEVLAERQELLRFGGSRITYQHAEERLRLRARLVRDGRTAWGTIESLDVPALVALRTRLEALIDGLPRGQEEMLSVPSGAARPAVTAFPMDQEATAERRVALLGEIAARLPVGTTMGGSIAHSSVQHAIANTAGLRRAETRTRGTLQVVAEYAGRSSYARLLHRDPAALTAERVVERLLPGMAALPSRPLEPGSYRAVLAPPAVCWFVALLGQVALGAREYLAGQGAFSGRMGEQVLGEQITLVDDGCDAAGLPSSFDCQGVPKQRVSLVENGVLYGVVHNDETAALAGVASTGHAVPPAWRFGAGPCPSHLLLEPGNASDEELLAACGHGLFIQRVDYVRVLQAPQTLVTGTTRDATLWIEDGRAVARLPQFRFSLKLTDLFSAVALLGSRRERGDTVFMESVVAPAMLVEAFPVGVVVDA